MRIIADTHIHFYPCYDRVKAVKSLLENLSACSGEADVKAVFLTERSDCRFYSDLLDGREQGLIDAGYTVDPLEGCKAAVVKKDGKRCVYVLPGRQIVTSENIEILALATDEIIEDRKFAAWQVVDRTHENDGIPVVAWAPGKWFFDRGRVVKELIGAYGAGELMIGDTTLRPLIWSEPVLMRAATDKGLKVLSGSDPLPFEGEEKYMGVYGSLLQGDFNENRPATSMKKILRTAGSRIESVGSRCGLREVAARLKNNRAARKCGDRSVQSSS